MPTMYVWIVKFVTNLVWLGVVAVTGFFLSATAFGFIAAMQGKGEKPGQTAIIIMFVVIGLVAILAVFLFSFALIYNMRVVGLLAYYFKDSLDLVVVVGEKTYVRREIPVDRFGNPIKTTGQKVGTALLLVGVLLLVVAVGCFAYYMLFMKQP